MALAFVFWWWFFFSSLILIRHVTMRKNHVRLSLLLDFLRYPLTTTPLHERKTNFTGADGMRRRVLRFLQFAERGKEERVI